MHPIKWIRKHMTKLMAIVVIFIMIAFIMPTLLSQLAKPRLKEPTKAAWYYDTDKGISFNDIQKAASELAALKILYVDRFFIGQRDLRFSLLAQLLFPESAQPSLVSDEIKNIALQNQLLISPSRIDRFFEEAKERPELFWILLKAEAKNAGCIVPQQRAGEILNALIPKITDNKIDAQTLVRNAGQVNQMTDDMVLAAFADFLSIVSYARIITDTEDITEAQTESTLSKIVETVNAEFVDFSSEKFIDKTHEPGKSEISAQFEKYKGDYPNIITQENPCGFGYRQKPRVAVEYVIIKLDDAKKLVTPPTEEEAEEFYQKNIDRFTEQVPADINDPNSELIQRQRSYAEVAETIKKVLFTRKASSKAINILNDTVEQAQAGFESLNLETAAPEQLKEKTTDYAAAAGKIARQNDIKIYAGKTSLLTAEEMQQDRCLGSLLMQTQGRVPISMIRLAFATQQLGSEAAKVGPFEPPKPKMFVSFGPLADTTASILAMVRVIETKNSAVPDLTFSYEKNLPQVFEDRRPKEKTFSLEENVKQDCRRLTAFDTARQKADEFAKMAGDKGWDKAIEKFNLLYPVKDGNENQKNFEIQKWDKKNRISQTDIETAKLRAEQLVGAENLINQSITAAKLVNEFYSLFKSNETQLENVPQVVEFKPQLACYVIKNLSRNLVAADDYEKARSSLAFRENYMLTQSMALEHFMPENIFKRLNFRPAEPEPNQPAKTDANGV